MSSKWLLPLGIVAAVWFFFLRKPGQSYGMVGAAGRTPTPVANAGWSGAVTAGLGALGSIFGGVFRPGPGSPAPGGGAQPYYTTPADYSAGVQLGPPEAPGYEGF